MFYSPFPDPRDTDQAQDVPSFGRAEQPPSLGRDHDTVTTATVRRVGAWIGHAQAGELWTQPGG